jgi:MFS family permease
VMNTQMNWFLSFRFFTTVAMQMKMTILGYFLYKISGTALALGMLGLYEALPRILLALPAGYQVERMEKRKALIIVVGSYFILALFMYFAMTYFHNQNSIIKNCIFLGVFLMGVIGSMGMGASVALLSSIIPRDQMAQYSAMSSNAWQIGAVVGPILGGYLIKYTGSENAFLVVVLFVFIKIF